MSAAATKVAVVYGTRPEAIKVAPLIAALEDDERFDATAVVTGQHREMLDQVNALFEIVPRYDLDLMRPGQSLNSIVARAIDGVDDVMLIERPDLVVVQGDTSTAMAAGLAAFNRGIKVVHLEAGLRTGDLDSPFPEEANRRLLSQVSRLHLAPTAHAAENLLREGVDPDRVRVTGNTVIDALLTASRWVRPSDDPALDALLTEGRPIILATAHRRENQGDAMAAIGSALADIALARPDVTILLPLHRNPAVRDAVIPRVEHLQNVAVTDPLSYADFTKAMAAAKLVLTDSGGVQEEAPSLGKPVLVMRDNTERPEALAAGTVRLVGANRARIVAETLRLLDDPRAYAEMANTANPYGDGLASRRAVAAMAELVGTGRREADFVPA
ncbi:non-hydrolyzing UDP-N-acetylglucosamine 2-epimerase [Agrococcus sediminis]|uniref:non-hydrolyzing UDP-N-acetylglucosamine 2-epimerase n=1 Tax=Agrococcus sediminis TaxID=2599924 RepID=UPI00342085EE